MNEMTKESKFLDAINRYAESQKAQITQEIEEYKNIRIEQATEQGLKDAYDLIRGDISKRKAAIVNATAKKELEMRRELFCERSRIAEEVFDEARKRLGDFASSDGYKSFLESSAGKISSLFGEESCVLYIAPADERFRDMLSSILPKAEIKTDNRITIGGIRAYCKKLGITADDTLDARLDDQKEWFVANSGLKAV